MSSPGLSPPQYDLQRLDRGLALRARHLPHYGAILADWSSTEIQRRIRGGRRQLLGRAAGLHRRPALQIVDATAGLGRDAFVLAALGAEVTMLERCAEVCALLDDALARAHREQPDIAARLRLQQTDAIGWLSARPRITDVVMLDPMYPHDDKQALAKKEMQFLRELSGGDPDADALLEPALIAARQRVAVKRPLKAPPLAYRPPDLRLAETQARYDVYLVKRASEP